MSPPERERVETPRLVLERLRIEHADEVMLLLQDARVARTLFAGGEPPTEAEVLTNLDAKLAHWEQQQFGMWLMRDRASGAMVGRGGLQHTFVAGCNEVELGWAVVPERWGEGLATELAHAAIDVAFDQLRLPEIVAFTLPTNRASRRVMKKAGFVLERRVIHVGLEHVLYRRTAEPSRSA